MSNPRIYQNSPLIVGETVQLSDDAFGHLIRVLRLTDNASIILFNGQDQCDYQATLVKVGKKSAQALLMTQQKISNESPLQIHLGQGISRGDRMDFTLQKSVELGVNKITPLFTERCGVKLSGERLAKKRAQWQKIVISACEQSGRSFIPEVAKPMILTDWLNEQTSSLKLNLHPRASHSIMTLATAEKNIEKVRLLIGPEGGLSDDEIAQASKAQFQEVLLGPRILRTETAALTAITTLQCRFGDLK